VNFAQTWGGLSSLGVFLLLLLSCCYDVSTILIYQVSSFCSADIFKTKLLFSYYLFGVVNLSLS